MEKLIEIKRCNSCPFCNSYQRGIRVYHSCNLQKDSPVYWQRNGDYSKLFENCPLKGKLITFTVKSLTNSTASSS